MFDCAVERKRNEGTLKDFDNFAQVSVFTDLTRVVNDDTVHS